MPGCDLKPVEDILSRYAAEEPSLIQVLQDVQRAYNYLPCDVLARVSDALHVPLAKVFSVSTFYKAFSLTKQGRTIIKVCTGTACHIRGAEQLVEEVTRRTGLKPGQTGEDGAFTLQTVNCVGACAMAPIVIVGEKYHGAAKAAQVEGFLHVEGDHAN